MNKSKTKRKTRSDKFPLTLHSTGQYCKKIKGKIHYFGKDKNRRWNGISSRQHLYIMARLKCLKPLTVI
jgi:hypothetical protein